MLRAVHFRAASGTRVLAAVVLAVAIGASACVSRSHGTTSEARATSTRVLLALGVPEPLASVQPDWTHAELIRARPATTYLLGLGREEQHGEWLAWYRFDDPPSDPNRSLEENLRQQLRPGARLQRVEFRRSVRGDSANTLWERAVARAVAVAATPARCSAFEIGALGAGRELRRGVLAYIPLPERRVSSQYQLEVSTVIEVAPLGVAGEPAGGFVRPERTVLTVTLESINGELLRPETVMVPCPGTSAASLRVR